MGQTKRFTVCELEILRAVLDKQGIEVFLPEHKTKAIHKTKEILNQAGFEVCDAADIIAQMQTRLLPFRLMAQRSDNPNSLHHAARSGDLPEVKKLIASGYKVNATDIFGSTPLHMAAMYGHKDVVEYLLSKGASINAKTYEMGDYSFTPLDLAAQYAPDTATFEFLLKKGAQPENWDSLVFTLLASAHDANLKQDYEQLDLALSKAELAASQNINALWVYTQNEATPIFIFYQNLATETTDQKFYNRIIKAVDYFHSVDSTDIGLHYIHAKELLHAFPSDGVYSYKIGPNKVTIAASGYFSFLSVDLATKTLHAFIENNDFTEQKWHIFHNVEEIFKQGAIASRQCAIHETSEEIFQLYQSGHTILLPTGWNGHAIDIILDKNLNLFMVANAGDQFGALQPGLNAYNHQFNITVDDIYSILTNQDQMDLEFKKFYDLGLIQNETYSFDYPGQMYGNCAWYSQQISQKALLFVELSKTMHNSDLAFDFAENWFKEYNEFHQKYVLKAYLSDPNLEVSALADILINYHFTLSSPHEKECAKMIIDVLTDYAHKQEFNAYYQSHYLQFTPELKQYIADTGYKLPYTPHKHFAYESVQEAILIDDVIQKDSVSDLVSMQKVDFVQPSTVLTMPQLHEDHHIHSFI